MKKLLAILLVLVTLNASSEIRHTLPVKDVEKESQVIILTEKNHTALAEEVSDASVKHVMADLMNRDESQEFFLYIESPGGSVIAGMLLVDYLQTQKNITCIASRAASMAFSILQACPKRIVTPTALLMQHLAYAGGSSDHETSSTLKTQAEILRQMNDVMAEMEAKRLGISKEKFLDLIQNEYWLIGAKKILGDNAADDSSSVICSKELVAKKVTKSQITPFGTIESEVSACPLL